MTVQENKTLTRRFVDEIVNKANMDSVDELVAPGFIDHTPYPGQNPGPEGVKQAMLMLRSAFPDMETLIEDLIGEDDKVVARSMWRGTHQGMFMGIPATGRPVRVDAVHVMRFSDGKIVEHWGSQDDLGLMQQIGAMPAMAPTAGL